VEVAVTDLGGAAASAGPLRGLHATRAERLAGQGGAASAVAAALLAEGAARDEADGRAAAAANGYARLLALDPGALEGVLGLERLTTAAGARREHAAVLVKKGRLLGDRSRAAACFAEAAALFAAEGLDDDAGAAYTEVLRRQPGDEAAYQQLHDLLAGRDDAAGLERLITFRLGRVSDPAAKVALYAERAKLRLSSLDRREDAIADHRRIVALAPGNLASLRALAALAAEVGRPATAAEYLQRALELTEDADAAHALRVELAAAHGDNDDGEAALRVLRTAAEQRPRDRKVRELLVEAAVGEQHWDLAATELKELRSLAETTADQAAWTVRLGRLERDQRRNRDAALDAFREALRLDPLGEAAREIASTLGELPLPAEDGPLVTAAVNTLRAAIVERPLSPRHLESLTLIARAGGLPDTAETAAQLHALLGGPPTRGRTRGLVRTLAPAVLAPRVQAPDVKRALELWPLLAEPLARLRAGEGAQLAATGASRATKLQPGREPRLSWAEAAANGLGLSGLTIYVAGRDDLGVSVFDAPEMALVLGRGVAGGDAGVRFRVGRALALLAQKAALIETTTLEDLRLDWASAVLYLTERLDPALDASALKARAKSLGKEMSRKERKALEPLAAGLGPSALDVAGWRTHVLRTANRAGLLVSGDLGAALRAATRQANPSPADLEGEDALDLIHFAFGEQFASLRQEARDRDRINAGGERGGAS
jgi:tetratricopeptide (TPR) repeat protein